MYNTFSFEGLHLAELLGARSVLATPSFHHTAAPPRFGAELRAQLPELWERLCACQGTEWVSWMDVQLWMWPAFTSHWEGYREELGLEPVPCLLEKVRAPLVLIGESS